MTIRRNAVYRRQRPFLVTILISALMSGGCGTVNTDPFVEFASSTQTLRLSSARHMQTLAGGSREKLLAAVKAGELDAADLQLTFEGPFAASYGAAGDEPLAIKEERFGRALGALNDAVVGYAQSLVLLAGGDPAGDILPSQQGFDQMAKDLNKNAMAAANTLQLDVGARQGALLSTVAVRLFQAYIENQRRETLAEAIAEVQPGIAAFATAADQATRLLAEGIETDYLAQFVPLATATPADVRPILALNEETQARLATLKALSASYRQLPRAHEDLVRAASTRPGILAGLTALNQEVNRLAALVRGLEEANAKAAAEAEKTP